MRSIKELYGIVLEVFLKYDSQFICHAINDCYNMSLITVIEHRKLVDNFKRQKPNKKNHKEFFNHPTFKGDYSWWGGFTGDFKEQRIKFLNKLANK